MSSFSIIYRLPRVKLEHLQVTLGIAEQDTHTRPVDDCTRAQEQVRVIILREQRQAQIRLTPHQELQAVAHIADYDVVFNHRDRRDVKLYQMPSNKSKLSKIK